MINENELEKMTNEELLSEYRQTKNQRLKQEIVLRYVYLVRNIAIQFRSIYANFTQIDDIVNEGIIALMLAVDKFDPEKNTKFETFVSKRLKGLIIDIARKQDWVPRSLRKDSKEIDLAIEFLLEKLGRYPTNKEIAEYMNISIDKYLKILGKTSMCNLISLDYFISEKTRDKTPEGLISKDFVPEDNIQRKEINDLIRDAIMTLREKEQIVISLYYRKELTMKEIARVMQLSEPRISQIHSKALKKLKAYVEKNKHLL